MRRVSNPPQMCRPDRMRSEYRNELDIDTAQGTAGAAERGFTNRQ